MNNKELLGWGGLNDVCFLMLINVIVYERQCFLTSRI